MREGLLRAVLLGQVLTACVKAPDLVILDRKTALEQQAAGNFRGLEEELEQAGIVPGPVPLTRGQLEAAGVRVAAGPETGTADGDGEPDLTRSDALLL